jgi:5-methylcytosine-specific restriction enzyme A
VVTLSDVTRTGVLAAFEEFDRLGREAFLKSTGFGAAKAYFVQHDGKLYDSKAIAGYAHGVSAGVRLGPRAFSGGDKTVAQRLQMLGFTVLNLNRPHWTRDEIILACALAEANDWRQVYDSDPRAKELSQLLQSPAIHPFPRHPDFRNPAGVGQKTRNIIDQHPDHDVKKKSNGNRVDKEVLDDFLADPVGMRAMASRVRELFIAVDAGIAELPDLDPVDIVAGEGGVALRSHLRRERDPKLRRGKLADTKKRGLPMRVRCAASTTARPTVHMAWTTSNATTEYRCTSQARLRPGWLTWLCCVRTATGSGPRQSRLAVHDRS